jgi:hypothetical protein
VVFRPAETFKDCLAPDRQIKLSRDRQKVEKHPREGNFRAVSFYEGEANPSAVYLRPTCVPIHGKF